MSGAEGQGPEKGQSSKADKGQASKTGALKRQYQFRHSESDSDSVSWLVSLVCRGQKYLNIAHVLQDE